MPYFITDQSEQCSGWAVVKQDGEVMGCHTTKEDAISQMVAISQAEGIEPGGERALPDNYRPALADDVPEGRACGNCYFYNEEDVQGDKAYCELWDAYVNGAYYCNRWQEDDGIEERVDAPAPPKDQITGSDENEPGSAEGKLGDIKLSEATEKGLQNKADEHNQEMAEADRPNWTRVRVGALRSVYRRGSGAYSVSHRPGTTREQWSMARVNAFLYLARTGRPQNAKYIGDNDLLHADHPRYAEKKQRSEERAPINPDGYMPTEAMQAEAKRGLDWRAEFGRGGTLVGVARARDIVNGRNLPFETVVRMRSYFARHEVDKQGQGFNTGEDGYPSAGRIAWALWGGDAGKRWADNIVLNAERKEKPKMAIEYRQFQTEIRAEGEDGHTFTGYAAIFNSEAEGLSTREIIKPGAFSKSVAAAERGDWEVKALQDHDPKYFLGSTKTGTLDLEEDDRGLKVRVSLNPEVTFASDLAAMLRRDGAAMGMSFGFSVPNKGDAYDDNGVRELRNIRLHEVSLLTGNQPAYPATIGLGAVRSLSERTAIDPSTLMRAFDALLAGAPDADSAATLDLAIRKISPDLRPEPETTTEPEEADERLVPLSVRERQLALAKLEQQIR
jgi:HK97 family phage prohead protease